MKNIDIKKDFYRHFDTLLQSDKSIMRFFYEIFIYGSAYIVGGYFRDFLNQKKSRDIDVIVDISASELLRIVKESKAVHAVNRHGGIKINFESIQLDIWTIHDNWAFKTNLVKLNEDDKLNSIAKGCFYNYDSLVINLHSYSYNLRHYNDFLTTQKLDILQASPSYKNLNPTTEANILRAFYVKFKHKASYTKNTYQYLLRKVGALNDKPDSNAFQRLILTREKYSKYSELTDSIILNYLNDLKDKDNPDGQLFFGI